MNKKLLTLAVAAAIAAPAAAVADATIYGVGQLSLDSWDVDTGVSQSPGGLNMSGSLKPNSSADFDGLDVGDGYHSNRFGIKGSEDLGNGLKAIFKMEFAVNMADETSKINGESAKVGSSRNMYVGLSGDWGTALIGRSDTPYKSSTGRLDMFADTVADYNFGNGMKDIRADNIIMYVSPNWNGLTVSGALVAPGCKHLEESGCNTKADGFEGYSIAAMYSNGPWYVSGAYEMFDKEMFGGGTNDEDDEKWRIGFGYTLNAFKFAAVYEDWDWGEWSTREFDAWQVSASYTFGNNVVKAMYGQRELENSAAGASDEDADTWAIGIDHNFSKRTKAYIIYTDWENDDVTNAEYDVFSLGLRHTF